MENAIDRVRFILQLDQCLMDLNDGEVSLSHDEAFSTAITS